MKKIFVLAALMTAMLQAAATDYYLSTTGSDTNNGKSRTEAFATMGAAQKVVKAGDNVYILPGTYTVTEAEISKEDNPYNILFNLNHRGQQGKPICFIGLTENGKGGQNDGGAPIYDLQGRLVSQGWVSRGRLSAGIYIWGGQKYIVKR